MTTNTHPADCALCPLGLGGTHVYVSPETQARRVAAASATNARFRAYSDSIFTEPPHATPAELEALATEARDGHTLDVIIDGTAVRTR